MHICSQVLRTFSYLKRSYKAWLAKKDAELARLKAERKQRAASAPPSRRSKKGSEDPWRDWVAAKKADERDKKKSEDARSVFHDHVMVQKGRQKSNDEAFYTWLEKKKATKRAELKRAAVRQKQLRKEARELKARNEKRMTDSFDPFRFA